MSRADSAGQPWEGRSFGAPSAWSGDDGGAPAAYLAALAAFRRSEAGLEAVVDALRDVRLLVPLLAELGESDVIDGRRVENPHSHGRHAASRRAGTGERGPTQELALVTVAGPDGRSVLPAFSSTAAMSAWNPSARPIPAPARQVALGAAGDGTELVIVDPASADRLGLRRSALEALARDLPWTPPFADPAVGRAIRRAATAEPAVTTVRVASGDPRATLDGAEVQATVVLHETLAAEAVGRLLVRLQERWSADPVVRARVDSMSVRVTAEFC